MTGLHGVLNFRDFGGAPGATGRRVRRGRLYRSGHHGAASEADLQTLGRIGFTLRVDLRRPGERARDPGRRPADCMAEVLEHQGPLADALAPHLAFLAEPGATAAQVTKQMTVGYRGYPFDPHYVSLYRAFFEKLAATDGPVLINCHAGKDRTGLLCALTLHVLGVGREDIMADYLASNLHSRADARMGDLVEQLRHRHGHAVSDDLVRRLLQVDRAYLEAAFEAIETAHGALDAWLEDELGVISERRDMIRARYLE